MDRKPVYVAKKTDPFEPDAVTSDPSKAAPGARPIGEVAPMDARGVGIDLAPAIDALDAALEDAPDLGPHPMDKPFVPYDAVGEIVKRADEQRPIPVARALSDLAENAHVSGSSRMYVLLDMASLAIRHGAPIAEVIDLLDLWTSLADNGEETIRQEALAMLRAAQVNEIERRKG